MAIADLTGPALDWAVAQLEGKVHGYAMRCFVASRFGDEVDIPEELL